MKIILIRHASKERNLGRKKDQQLPLSPKGKKETCELGNKLAIVPDSKEWNKILSFFSPPYTMSLD